MQLVLLLTWTAIAALLRFAHLDTKPLWADEISTLVFSLGNSYLTIPLNQVLTWQDLLQPLSPNPSANLHSVIHHLLTESNHPPLYFVLTHLWLHLMPDAQIVSVWAGRSLSAGCGVAAVPAIFSFSQLAFRSRLIAHLAALLMALSPFGIYLAQEARHYTLAVLWILASLSCLVVVAQRIASDRPIPYWLCLTWIGVNGLGIATHYFFLLALAAVALSLLYWLMISAPLTPRRTFPGNLRRVGLVAAGTIASMLIWLPFLLNIHTTELTRWIQVGEFDHSTRLDQLLRTIAGLISMVYLLPIQGVPLWTIIPVSLIAILLFVWTIPLLQQGWLNQTQSSATCSMLLLLGGFVIASLGLSLVLTFVAGINLASVFRYQFIHLPGVIVLVAVALSNYWTHQTPVLLGLKTIQMQGRTAIAIVLSFSLLGSMTVVHGWGYQRPHKPEQVALAIDLTLQQPTLIAIPHKTHAHTSRLMAIAWELQRLNPAHANCATFLLAHSPWQDLSSAIAPLQKALNHLPRPLNVWRINFRSQANPSSHNVLTQAHCTAATPLQSIDGYRYQQYRCPATERST